MADKDERFDSLKRYIRGEYGLDSKVPILGLRKNGTLSVNRAALKLLGEPEKLALHYSSECCTLIGVRPTTVDDSDGYNVNRSKKGEKSGYIDISSALRNLGVEVEVAVRGQAIEHGGGLYLDLLDFRPPSDD